MSVKIKKNGQVRFTMTGRQVEGVRDALQLMVNTMIEDGLNDEEEPHEFLLFLHARDMLERFNNQVDKMQESNMMTFEEVEVVAFCQLYRLSWPGMNPYDRTCVRNMFDKLDQKRVSKLWITEQGERMKKGNLISQLSNGRR